MPPLREVDDHMLQEFMARVKEWTEGRNELCGPSSLRDRARQAFLKGLGPSSGAEKLRQEVKAQWSKKLGNHGRDDSQCGHGRSRYSGWRCYYAPTIAWRSEVNS